MNVEREVARSVLNNGGMTFLLLAQNLAAKDKQLADFCLQVGDMFFMAYNGFFRFPAATVDRISNEIAPILKRYNLANAIDAKVDLLRHDIPVLRELMAHPLY